MFKNRLKTLLVVVVILVQGILFVPRIVFASDYQLSNFATIAGYDTTDQSKSTLTGLSQTVIRVFLSLLGIVFIGFALYAGIRWMTAQGNEEDVTKAKDTLQAAIIGMIVIAMSYAITTLVFGLLNKQNSTTNPNMQPKVACTKDADCSGVQKCVAGDCFTPGGGNEVAVCSSNNDCDAGFQVCFNGACISQTSSNCNLLGSGYTWVSEINKCAPFTKVNTCQSTQSDCKTLLCTGDPDPVGCKAICDTGYINCLSSP